MIKKEDIAVVVPTYKERLSELEHISLFQLFQVLGTYDIFYVAPQSLHAEYLEKARVERFTDHLFEGIAGYNQLMLSKDFYMRFIKYKYILIYQLDAFVFYDGLLEFCNLGYDYIGAPWLTGMRKKVNDEYIYANVGNGGFSLRNVQSILRLLTEREEELKNYKENEDKFFSFNGDARFKVAPVSVALKFAFEREVKKCFEKNNNKLPFGCHAWERYDYKFWRTHIEKLGYKLPDKMTELGMEDEKNYELYRQNEISEKFWTFNGMLCIENREYRKIAIFGTGMYGKKVLSLMGEAGISVECFIDNDVKLQGGYIKKCMIKSPKILEENEVYFTVIAISGNNMNDVRRQLESMGKTYKKDYITYIDLIS